MPDAARRVGQLIVKIDGTTLAPELAARLDLAIIEDDLVQPAMFELRFNDPRFEVVDGSQMKIGGEVTLLAEATAGGQPKQVLAGDITAIETTFEQDNMVVIVRGYDRAHRLQRGSKTRTFLKQKDSDIAAKIAQEAGLSADTEDSGIRHEYVVQANQTDLEFLHARARRLGYRVSVNARTLVFRSHAGAPRSAPAQVWGETLLAFRARLTAANQPVEVTARGWDMKTKREITGTASRSASPSAIGEQKNGPQLARSAFGADQPLVLTGWSLETPQEATQLAQAVLDETSGDFLVAEALCRGEPDIRAGAKVEVRGVGTRMSGSYYVTASRHEYSAKTGYLTTFYVSGRRPTGLLAAIEHPPPPVAAAPGVVIGLVTNNNDPDKLGRVKVKFPWLDGTHETSWVRVVSPGAGKQRGLQLLPEIDDEVLVAFEYGDWGRPFVLGGLWNGKDAPPEPGAVTSGAVQTRMLKTRAGHTIVLDDSDGKGAITVTTGGSQGTITLKTGKHTVTLADDGTGTITIESGGDLELKGAGGSLSVTAQGVELKANTGSLKIAASGVELTSSANLKVQANAMLDVKTSAILNIQGSLVKIN